MAPQNDHGKLIAAAAKAALAPLGCRRKGQSRFWYSDQRFWAISVEFQPSAWSKGSYLNVGAMWFWYPKKNWSFDVGHRVEEADFISFENVQQFAPLIARMAAQAAQQVTALREQFKSIAISCHVPCAKARRSIMRPWPRRLQATSPPRGSSLTGWHSGPPKTSHGEDGFSRTGPRCQHYSKTRPNSAPRYSR